MVKLPLSLRMASTLVFLYLFHCLASVSSSEARIRHYKWEVKYEYKSPDCFKELVITINGRSPGPTIQAHQEGDTIIFELKNSLLAENLAIHRHGIRQIFPRIGAPWFHGTEGVTQCPIIPGDTSKCQFVVDRPVTDLYHSHFGMQKEAGLYGMIKVSPRDPEPFTYDYERSIILNDWFNKSTYEQATGLSSKDPLVPVGEPQSLLINGRSPGPTIQAQEGNTIIVELKNSLLTENLAIHWHGIRQIGAPWFDGTEGVTQCPIIPGDTLKYQFVVDRIGTSWFDDTEGVTQCPILLGDTFKHQFVVDRPGTYLYHSHYGMQREAELYGMIKVSPRDPEPFTYDYERSIILNDWFHKSTYEQANGLSSKGPFVRVGEPQSFLINGRGRFNCSKLATPSVDAGVCNTSNPDCSPYVQTVISGKTYQLRIGSLTASSVVSFQIEGHNMTVVEADGHYVEPFVV